MAGASEKKAGPLVLMGCGKMGGALLRGWLARDYPADRIFAIDPKAEGLGDVAAAGVALLKDPAELPASIEPALVLLAVKPQFMDAALPPYRRFAGPRTIFLSIAAGKTRAYFRRHLGPDAMIVRAMPNTPAAIGRGMSVIHRDPALPEGALDLCRHLLEAVGEVAFVDEEGDLDPVTALSGGGPAYVFLLIEYLAEAGRANGLPADLALRLARATVCGSGELAYRSSESVTALRHAVMSPKGTTIEALAILMAEDGLQPLLTRAIEAATRRSRELAES